MLKRGEAPPAEIERKDMLAAFNRRMHPLHLLRRGAVEVQKRGVLAPVQIAVRTFGKRKV